jgi:isoleucyl-tRNA synthetase
VLTTFARVLAPVLPFITESLYQNLVVEPGVARAGEESVHLTSYPVVDESRIDAHIERDMAVARAVVNLGRVLREKHKLKTRQPLARVTVVSHSDEARAAVQAHVELLCEELNVKSVVTLKDDADLASLSFKANFKTLGKRMGPRMKEAAAAVEAFSRADFEKLERGEDVIVADQKLALEDVLVTRTARGDVVIASEGEITIALDTTLTDALVREGLFRDFVSQVQRQRKDSGLAITDRIALHVTTTDDALTLMVREHEARIAEEVLATSIVVVAQVPGEGALDFDGHALAFTLAKA